MCHCNVKNAVQTRRERGVRSVRDEDNLERALVDLALDDDANTAVNCPPATIEVFPTSNSMKSTILPVSKFNPIVSFAELRVRVEDREAVAGDDGRDLVRPDDALMDFCRA